MKKLTLLFLLAIVVGCEVEDGRGINCGEEFHVLSVEIVNTRSEKVLLDRFSVVDVKTKEDLSLHDGKPSAIDLLMGVYPIIDDNSKSRISEKSSVNVMFKGYIGEEEVCSREFCIRNDGCNLYIAKGDTELVIDR